MIRDAYLSELPHVVKKFPVFSYAFDSLFSSLFFFGRRKICHYVAETNLPLST